VRGLEYRKIGSSGASTLLALGWFLSIFETSIENDGKHPNFVLIDSPQKNISKAAVTDPDYRDSKIINGVYEHIIEKASEYGNEAQWIVVDNYPPAIAEPFIKIRFSSNAEIPPYGLIDDET
jgi:TRAP-type uncharacterized transport system substrate-binding protein